jgi:hypothetical protein
VSYYTKSRYGRAELEFDFQGLHVYAVKEPTHTIALATRHQITEEQHKAILAIAEASFKRMDEAVEKSIEEWFRKKGE